MRDFARGEAHWKQLEIIELKEKKNNTHDFLFLYNSRNPIVAFYIEQGHCENKKPVNGRNYNMRAKIMKKLRAIFIEDYSL